MLALNMEEVQGLEIGFRTESDLWPTACKQMKTFVLQLNKHEIRVQSDCCLEFSHGKPYAKDLAKLTQPADLRIRELINGCCFKQLGVVICSMAMEKEPEN